MAKTRIPLNPEDEERKRLEENLKLSIAEIGLSNRTVNALEAFGIFNVHQLLHTKASDLLGIDNFGDKALSEVYKTLAALGFTRKKNS